MTDYVEVTEIADDEVTKEQVARVCTRYGWAVSYCHGKDVLEVACGTGPGLGQLAKAAKKFVAGDISEAMLQRVGAHYGNRIDLRRIDAQSLPFEKDSLDVVIIFEALYYVPNAATFVAECSRVLRPGGVVLISNANKDLSDFNPSPHSHVYHGVVELRDLFKRAGFVTAFWGDVPIGTLSLRQKILRPIKRTVVALNLMPTSMAGKKLLKRLVFGDMTRFPREITAEMVPTRPALDELSPDAPNRTHKVILCCATKSK